MNGQIITFYSYKGGLGRTMALANVAWILASSGRRVLVMDWHLDAPGLHRYFAPFLLDPLMSQTAGVIDFFGEYANILAREPKAPMEKYSNILRNCNPVESEFPGGGGIDIIGAGRIGPSYSPTVNAFSWFQFYDRMQGARFLKLVREQVKKEYDYVLIDAQPGSSEVSSLCVMTLPDVLVVCCGLNYQNIEGAATIAKAAHYGRNSEPCVIYPALMRVDWNEKKMLDDARQAAAREFEPVMGHISNLTQYWGDTEFPYIPFYSYVEALAPFVEASRTPQSVLSAAEHLTFYLTGGRIAKMPPVPEAERQRVLDAFLRRGRLSDER